MKHQYSWTLFYVSNIILVHSRGHSCRNDLNIYDYFHQKTMEINQLIITIHIISGTCMTNIFSQLFNNICIIYIIQDAVPM